jgi:hypothetical protein
VSHKSSRNRSVLPRSCIKVVHAVCSIHTRHLTFIPAEVNFYFIYTTPGQLHRLIFLHPQTTSLREVHPEHHGSPTSNLGRSHHRRRPSRPQRCSSICSHSNHSTRLRLRRVPQRRYQAHAHGSISRPSRPVHVPKSRPRTNRIALRDSLVPAIHHHPRN